MKRQYSRGFLISISLAMTVLLVLWGMHAFLTPQSSVGNVGTGESYVDMQKRESEQWLTSATASLTVQEDLDILDELPVAEEPRRTMLVALLAIKEREGRDNAMIHYMRAS